MNDMSGWIYPDSTSTGSMASPTVHGGFQVNQLLTFVPTSMNGFTDGVSRDIRTSGGYGDMVGFPGYKSDPFWQDVTLLIRPLGYHNSIDIVDSSPRQKVVTSNGACIFKSTLQSAMGGADTQNNNEGWTPYGMSIRCGRVNSRQTNFFTVNLGADGIMRDDFTIEIWAWAGSNTTLMYPMPRDVGGPIITTNWNWNQCWNHWALTRQSGWIYQFLNGRLQTVNFDTFVYNLSPMYFGFYPPNGNGVWNGDYGEIRVTRGHCRYRYNFYPAYMPPNPGTGLANNYFATKNWLDYEGMMGGGVRIGKYRPIVTIQTTSQANTASTALNSVSVSFLSNRVPYIDDLLVATVVWQDDNGTPPNTMLTPAGWTLLNDDVLNNCHQTTYWKISDGTEPSVTFTLSSGTSVMACGSITMRNVDIVTGIVGFTQINDAVAANNVTAPAQTGAVNDGLIVSIGACHGQTGSAVCTPSPAGWSDFPGVDISAGPTVFKSLDMASFENFAAPTSSPAACKFTWNVSGTIHQACSFQVYPRPDVLWG